MTDQPQPQNQRQSQSQNESPTPLQAPLPPLLQPAAAADQGLDQPPVKLSDLIGFWFGNRRAITAVLQSRSTLWLGGLLVASAALGREYDAVSLLHRPWELLGSFAASLLMCTILFGFIYTCLGCIERSETNGYQEYLTFLSGYWMTAPLAWFYAFPIETMTDELTSIYFNLTALSIVSIWRVLLFARIVAIQFAIPYLSSLVWVLVPCMAVAFVALISAMLPMVAVMGGIRLTRTQQILVDYQSGLLLIIFYAAIPVLIAMLVSFAKTERYRPARAEVRRSGRKLARGPWVLAASSIAVLLVFGFPFQVSYWEAAEIDRLLASGRVQEAVERLERNGPGSPPATWDPLPLGSQRGPQSVDILPIIEELARRRAPAWLNDLLLVQADELIFRQAGFHFGTDKIEYLRDRLDNMEPTELHSLEHAFAQLNAVERGNLEEKERAVELHLLIIAASKDRVASAKERVPGIPSTDGASASEESTYEDSTGEPSASEKKVESGETTETADE